MAILYIIITVSVLWILFFFYKIYSLKKKLPITVEISQGDISLFLRNLHSYPISVTGWGTYSIQYIWRGRNKRPVFSFSPIPLCGNPIIVLPGESKALSETIKAPINGMLNVYIDYAKGEYYTPVNIQDLKEGFGYTFSDITVKHLKNKNIAIYRICVRGAAKQRLQPA